MIVKASAEASICGSSAAIRDASASGDCQTGMADGGLPTRSGAGPASQSPPWRVAHQQAMTAASKASSMCGPRRHHKRPAPATASVRPPTAKELTETPAAHACQGEARPVAPIRPASAYQPISPAAPLVKPSITEGEMKFASVPIRASANSSCIKPTPSVSASASGTTRLASPAASGTSIAPSASEVALVGPDKTCRLDPASAAIAHGSTAAASPMAGGRPASAAKAIACGSTSTAPSRPASRSARKLLASTSRTQGPSRRASRGGSEDRSTMA